MSSSVRIAIVGGGLAGLAAAQALKAFGMKAEVFEAAPALCEIGAAVNISPQAVKALQAIGLGNEVAAVGTASPGSYTRNMQTGDFLEFHDRHKAGQRFGAPYYTFHRADLLDALASGLDRNAIHLGHRMSGIEERNDHVMLAVENGACAEAEYLIGADGVRSVIRQALYGADNPTYTGQMVWRALLNSSDVPFEAIEPTGHVQWVGPGCHLLAYYIRGNKLVKPRRTPINGSRKAGRPAAIPMRCGIIRILLAAGLSVAATTWPLAAGGQQARQMRRIGTTDGAIRTGLLLALKEWRIACP